MLSLNDWSCMPLKILCIIFLLIHVNYQNVVKANEIQTEYQLQQQQEQQKQQKQQKQQEQQEQEQQQADFISKDYVVKQILHIIDNVSQTNKNGVDMNWKFTALLGEFLIKQKNRFYVPTRYEEQIYYYLLEKLKNIAQKPDFNQLNVTQKEILNNIFQKNVLLRKPTLKAHNIDTHMEYESMMENFEQFIETAASGALNSTLSDQCIAAIVSLESCNNLRDDCLNAITSDLPTFGYTRLHHCSINFGSPAAFEILTSEKCTQTYREKNVIRNFGIPMRYRDLYLEQNVICGLFGYTDYLNFQELNIMKLWNKRNGCFCMQFNDDNDLDELNCDCHNHINSLALTYYINLLLMLF